jgi:hypothetical protein
MVYACSDGAGADRSNFVISSSERQISNCFATRGASGEAPAKATGRGRAILVAGGHLLTLERDLVNEEQREAVPCSLRYLSHCTLPALAYYRQQSPATCSLTSRTRQSSEKRSVSIIIAWRRDGPFETGRQGKAGRNRYSRSEHAQLRIPQATRNTVVASPPPYVAQEHRHHYSKHGAPRKKDTTTGAACPGRSAYLECARHRSTRP